MSGGAGGAAAPPVESTQGGGGKISSSVLPLWRISGLGAEGVLAGSSLSDCSSETVVLRVSQRGWDTAWTPSVGEDGNLASVVWWD